MSQAPDTIRRRLLGAYSAALEAVRGDRLVHRSLASGAPSAPVALLAAGKAATAMARGATEALGDTITRALVVGPDGAPDPGGWPFPSRVLAGDHPVPGERSLAAGRAVVDFLEQGAGDETLLVLVSGGASSLAEAPPDGVTLGDLQEANRWLLGAGWDIGRVNAVRQRLSRLKGGGLATRLRGRRALVLALSDVPDNDPAVIGSGWLAPPLPEPDRRTLPRWLLCVLDRVPAPPSTDDPVWRDVETRIVGDNATALNAAAAWLRRDGLAVRVHETRLEGDVGEVAVRLADGLAGQSPGVDLRGGECTVRLPEAPGCGGRCQHLALSVAQWLAGRDDWFLLVAGTDGRDGDSEVAGALVDGGTIQRGETEGLSVREALERADSGPFLQAAGDLVDTGPTGTNVNDLVIGLKI